MSSISNNETTKIFLIRKRCFMVLQSRGYVVEEGLSVTLECFKNIFGDCQSRANITILVKKVNDASDQILVFFPDEDNVGINTIKFYCAQMKKFTVRKAIVVLKNKMTSFAKNAIEICGNEYEFECFRDKDLLGMETLHETLHNL